MGQAANAQAGLIDRSNWIGDESFVKAVDRAGGVPGMVRWTTLTETYVLALLEGNEILPPHLCAEVEKASGVPCEELRDDLVWFRDGAGYPIAYAASLERDDPALAEAAIRSRYQSSAANNDEISLRDAMHRLFGPEKGVAWWSSVSLTEERHTGAIELVNHETAARISAGCENLLFTLERGMVSVWDLIWNLSVSDRHKEIRPEVHADVAYLLKTISQYMVELRGLKSCADNRVADLKEEEA
jgi:DNA-binding transcriptional regulator YdaS (Cro superfamily)